MIATNSKNRAFTLTELLVVISTVALLGMILLPVLAGTQNKAGRIQCAANLRQIYVGSMIYANQYHGWLPINNVHGNYANKLSGIHYTSYVLSASQLSVGPNSFVRTNIASVNFSDLGFLYHTSLAGNGSIFYCPDAWRTGPGADSYSPLLTTDSGGNVRSSYYFNPRIIDPANANVNRSYQKTQDLPAHKLFVVDYFAAGFPLYHFRENGLNVLFTDGSVQFSRNQQAYNLIQTFYVAENIPAYEQADQIMNYLELDH